MNKQAAGLFRAAAEQGLAASQNNLGLCYLEGKGVEKNELQAYIWLALAAGQGHEKAGLKRDAVRELLSQEQLAQATEALETFHPTEPAQQRCQDR